MSKVSVIVPVYNAGNKLHKCIKSILNQTHNDLELILINDGSTDNSFDICKDYAEKDNRVIVINKKNEGLIKTRQLGIQESKCDYIIFVDADDWINKKMIELLYKKITESNSDLVVCKYQKVMGKFNFIKKDMNGNLQLFLDKSNVYENEDLKNIVTKSYFFSGCFPCSAWSRIYSKDLLLDSGEYLNRIKFFGEDLYLNFEVFLKSKKVTILDETLYYYRFGGGTSKYMPYYFDDIVNGYEIKREIAEKFYMNDLYEIIINMSINFLDLYKSSLLNIMYSELTEDEIKNKIENQISNLNISTAINCLSNTNYDKEFIDAIKNRDINYLYLFGLNEKKNRISKDKLMNILSKLIN